MLISAWALIGLLAFSLAVTAVTKWLVARLQGFTPAFTKSFAAISADLIWVLLIFAGGAIATRYIERLASAVGGYLMFGFVAFGLSLVRALLYRQVEEQRQPIAEGEPRLDKQESLDYWVQNATYLLFPLTLYLGLSWLTRRPANPIFFVPLGVGALLPDLDSRTSIAGRLLPFISRRLESRLGHLQDWHSPAAAALIALVTAPLILVIGVQAWCLIPLGFVSHIALDTLSPQGVMLFWPFTRTRYYTFGGCAPGRWERRLSAALAILTIVLLLAVDLGPPPPPPAVALSYEQTLERYYALRGRSLVFADVEGTWQATGRRVFARFEILNAGDRSFVMTDRYNGVVFTAGRTAADNLYLNSINVVAGSPIQVKPVEVQLHNERLAAALPVVYQMQQEPGLQHIFVSGQVITPAGKDKSGPSLPVDYAQTRLRRIQSHGDMADANYSLHYLGASDLVELANVWVETAELVVVATYTEPATGPTATPLPSPPPTPQSQHLEGNRAP